MPGLGELQRAAIGAVPEPGLKMSEEIRLRRPSPGALHAEQHGAEKTVQRGFPGLVLSVQNIDAVGEGESPVVEFSETADGQFVQRHCPLLSSCVRSSALTP